MKGRTPQGINHKRPNLAQTREFQAKHTPNEKWLRQQDKRLTKNQPIVQAGDNFAHWGGVVPQEPNIVRVQNGGDDSQASLLLFFLLLSMVAPVVGRCAVPEGSYRATCDVTGKPYFTVDPKLSSLFLCHYELICKDIHNRPVRTEVVIPDSMRACLSFFENCNGKPVLRRQNERVCTETSTTLKESRQALEL